MVKTQANFWPKWRILVYNSQKEAQKKFRVGALAEKSPKSGVGLAYKEAFKKKFIIQIFTTFQKYEDLYKIIFF